MCSTRDRVWKAFSCDFVSPISLQKESRPKAAVLLQSTVLFLIPVDTVLNHAGYQAGSCQVRCFPVEDFVQLGDLLAAQSHRRSFGYGVRSTGLMIFEPGNK